MENDKCWHGGITVFRMLITGGGAMLQIKNGRGENLGLNCRMWNTELGR